MPKLGSALQQAEPPGDPTTQRPGSGRVLELKVGGHLMTLEAGLFCVFHAPGSSVAEASSGLPGVRISRPPGRAGRPDDVLISTFREDGWLSGDHDAALIRVAEGPAQILVTVYQSPQAADAAPRLQVLQLSAAPTAAPVRAAATAVPSVAPPGRAAEIIAHVQRMGDVPGQLGDWIGSPGSQRWIEGFSIAPVNGIVPEEIEYQAVLGRGWLSPWVKGGEFCGSRGMALPILGLRLRLTGAAATAHSCTYAATFVDGSTAGPVAVGEACEAESLAPLEAFQVTLASLPSRHAAPSGPVRKEATRHSLARPMPVPAGKHKAAAHGKPLPRGRIR